MKARVSRRTVLVSSQAILAGAALGLRGPPAVGQSAGPSPVQERATAGAVRLAANENPYGPGPAAREAIAGAVGGSWMYPIGEEMALRAAIAEREGLTPRHVMIGAGSSEVLHLAAVVFGGGRGEVVTAAPTFDLAAGHARALGGVVREVALDAELRHDRPAIRAAVGEATGLVYVCNPNNPTGTLVPGAELRRFITALPAKVVTLVDEAYLELDADVAEESATPLVKAGRNVVVARTFSKLHGLAGLRIGYALAPPEIIERMSRLKGTVTNSLGLAAAAASYADLRFQEESRRHIAEGVAVTVAALEEIGLRHARTRANFVFFDTRQPIAAFLGAMRQRGFALGRPFPPYGTWCRVSMGTVAQMQQFAAALRAHYA